LPFLPLWAEQIQCFHSNISYIFILLAIPFFIALYFYLLNWKKKNRKAKKKKIISKSLQK